MTVTAQHHGPFYSAALGEHVERMLAAAPMVAAPVDTPDDAHLTTADLHPGMYVADDLTAWARVDRAVTLPTGARVVRWTLADGSHETTRYEPGEHFTRVPAPTR